MIASDDFSKAPDAGNLVVMQDGESLELPTFTTYAASSEPFDREHDVLYTIVKIPYMFEDEFEMLLNRYFSEGEWKNLDLNEPGEHRFFNYRMYGVWASDEERSTLSDICERNGLSMKIVASGEAALEAR